MGVPQNELAALRSLVLIDQQIIVELRRLERLIWVLSGKPEGFEILPDTPLVVPEVNILP
jgi:hypothetical protein